MRRPPLSSLLSLIVFHAVATCSVDAAPSTEVLFSTAPKAITGLYTGYDYNIGPRGSYVPNPNYIYTPWQLMTITEVEGQTQISYESFVRLDSDFLGNRFLLTEGFFVFSETGDYRPTPLFVDSTRPVDIEGGVWTFGYRLSNSFSLASWTWTESEPVMPVASSITLNRAITRMVRGKNPRKALPLLTRQQNLLDEALAATQ